MGFGFVVARFGLFLQVMQITRGGFAAQTYGFYPGSGPRLLQSVWP
jgi:hypothetical protein